jgi:rhodanese-related sulfurtransferase
MNRILATCLCLFAACVHAEVIDIDSNELAALTARGVPVIDIRTAPEWLETGIVPGSHLLTFFDERGRAEPAAWLEKASAIAKPGEPLVVICRSGTRTRAVSQFLSQQARYATVYNVRRGINAWLREGRPVTPAAATMAACRAAQSC